MSIDPKKNMRGANQVSNPANLHPNKWQIGDVTITRIVELEATGGSRFILPDATPEAVREIPWLMPHFANEEGKLIMSVHALVVEVNDRKIVVDTCIGNDKPRSSPAWNMLQLPFLKDLSTVGFDRLEIDTVLCTHLHVDHVGWNTMLVDGQWVPTFPNAKYLMARQEFDYWKTQDETEYGDVIGDSVMPVFEAGLVELVDLNHQICPEICLKPTLGHTPGHVSIHIESNGQQGVITGDCIHHPCQMHRNDWVSPADFNQSAAMATRTELFESLADTDCLVIGTHFATPTAGHVKRNGEAFWLDTEIKEEFKL
jgi:glyoxylase-like metal-dependent hydrolase (beta-lactamase superfamily II)